MVIKHPLSQNSSTSAHNPSNTALYFGQVLNQQSGVNGLVIDPLLAVLLDDVKEIFFI